MGYQEKNISFPGESKLIFPSIEDYKYSFQLSLYKADLLITPHRGIYF